MINKDFNSTLDLLQTFNDEQSCIDHLEELRWNGHIVSPFDASSKVYKCKGNKYRCKNTSKYFNATTVKNVGSVSLTKEIIKNVKQTAQL